MVKNALFKGRHCAEKNFCQTAKSAGGEYEKADMRKSGRGRRNSNSYSKNTM
jgi:hypothetical protein